jgi:hypothetical protein
MRRHRWRTLMVGRASDNATRCESARALASLKFPPADVRIVLGTRKHTQHATVVATARSTLITCFMLHMLHRHRGAYCLLIGGLTCDESHAYPSAVTEGVWPRFT